MVQGLEINDAMSEESGYVLRDNNEKIVRLISLLKKQRAEMNFLIEKQETEKGRIQNEIEKLSFKLTLLTKSLTQRLHARTNYDRTIKEIEDRYHSLVNESGKLLMNISKEYHELEEIMDKKIGTGSSMEVEKIPSKTTEKPPEPKDEKPQPQPIVEEKPKEVPETYDTITKPASYPNQDSDEEDDDDVGDIPDKPQNEDTSRRSSIRSDDSPVGKIHENDASGGRRHSASKAEEKEASASQADKAGDGSRSGSRRSSTKSATENRSKHSSVIKVESVEDGSIPRSRKSSSRSATGSNKQPSANQVDIMENRNTNNKSEDPVNAEVKRNSIRSATDSRKSSNRSVTDNITKPASANQVNTAEDNRSRGSSKSATGSATEDPGNRKNSKTQAADPAEKRRSKTNWRSISDTESFTHDSAHQESPMHHDIESDYESDGEHAMNDHRSSSIMASFNMAKTNKAIDEEVQSYREAYGRQHTKPEVPSRSPSGFKKPA